MKTLEIIQKLNKGQSIQSLDKELEAISRKAVLEDPKNKIFGECESCGQETALAKEVGLCGPCCFGESETAHGNF